MSQATCLTSHYALTTRGLPKGAHLHARNLAGRRRAASTKAAPSKSYASTLLLPKTKFKLWPDYTARDNALGKKTNQSLYAWQVNAPLYLRYGRLGHSRDISGQIIKDPYLYFTMDRHTPTGPYTWVRPWLLSRLVNLLIGTIGHGMNKILKDIINRYHVLQGRRVKWVIKWRMVTAFRLIFS